MWPIAAPPFTVAEVLTACLQGLSDTDLATRLRRQQPYLEDVCNELHTAAVDGITHSLTRLRFEVPGVTQHEMERVYNQRMAAGPRPGKSPSAGRVIYDQIMALAPYSRCPSCALRFVGEMDHFLPKTKYPAAALCPYNLIGLCGDCNTIKRAKVSANASEAFIYAYGPSWDGELWLTADVSSSEPPLVEFSVTPPSSWTSVQTNRARSHFDMYELGTLYMLSAISFQASIAAYLEELHDSGGSTAVRKHLAGQSPSYRAVRTNSWEAAMFDALASSHEYCDGDFGFAP